MSRYILALDQGTTSSRAILFDKSGSVVEVAQQEFKQILPSPGHVEHDASEIWETQLAVARGVLSKANASASDVAAIGVTNQRETTVLWDRLTGEPLGNAIVWQSRITAPLCDQLRNDGWEQPIQEKTGLVLDAYFSGTKIKYLLDKYDAHERARQGEILFGTIDSFLIWRLTDGAKHVTDSSNASRTMLYNIFDEQWDEELLRAMDVPRQMLPDVVSSSGVMGETADHWFGGVIPISGCAGDQQAATFGQACFEPGMAKNTYGTGCFMLLNTGTSPVRSENRLLTTIGWSIDGETTYCLEGSVFIGGAVVQWLRDGLEIIETSAEVEQLAAQVDDADGVVLVPAFVGLGAPHWDPRARGAIFGLTRGTTKAHLARAAVESMAFQSRDLLIAMVSDSRVELQSLKVDGGASMNASLMQFQADLLGIEVQRPVVAETTALGAAYLAGLAVGYWADRQEVVENWKMAAKYEPSMAESEQMARCALWHKAVQRAKDWAE